MHNILDRVRVLVSEGIVRISAHGYDELAADGLTARDLVDGLDAAELIEEYPSYPKGPCVLVLQRRMGARCMVYGGFPPARRVRRC